MQTFLPSEDYTESAEFLDRQRLGKQRVETLQILNARFSRRNDNGEVIDPFGNPKLTKNGVPSTRLGWTNHPATKMWMGYEESLVQYGVAICKEWIQRGYKDTCTEKIQAFLALEPVRESTGRIPWWLGDERLHSGHRARLLMKDYEHYKAFGWSEKPSENYWWPEPKEGYS